MTEICSTLIQTSATPTGMKCNRCGRGSDEAELTLHHQNPVCHYGRKTNQLKICLCVKCHAKIETYILSVESHLGNIPYGRRYKLTKSDYERIAKNFLYGRQIVYQT